MDDGTCLSGSQGVDKVQLGHPNVLLVVVAQRVERSDVVQVTELYPEVVPTHVEEEVDGVLELGRVDGYEAAGYHRSRTFNHFLSDLCYFFITETIKIVDHVSIKFFVICVNPGKGEDGYIDENVDGGAVAVSWDELLGVVAAVLEVVARVLVRLVGAVDLGVAAIAEGWESMASSVVKFDPNI